MNKLEVYELCKKIAPQYRFSPVLITALIEQESTYMEDAARQEPRFHSKYTKPMNYTAVVETLLATSFGLTQMMGESLRELGYFERADTIPQAIVQWLSNRPTLMLILKEPWMDSVNVAWRLDWFLNHPNEQVEEGCKWLDRKRTIAKGDIRKALLYWNGGADPQYDDKVLTRFERLKGELQ